MKIKSARIKNMKADIGKGKMTMTLEFRLDTENLTTCETLNHYTDKDSPQVEVDISPKQLPLI